MRRAIARERPFATRYSPFAPFEPLQRPLPAAAPVANDACKQIAAGRRFPVEHLAGGKHAGQPAEHEIGVEFVERDSARGRDRPRNRRDAGELDRNGVDEAAQDRPAAATKATGRMPLPPPAAGRWRPETGCAALRRKLDSDCLPFGADSRAVRSSISRSGRNAIFSIACPACSTASRNSADSA